MIHQAFPGGVQPPITIPGNPITTATKSSDIAVASLKGATTVTKPDPDADISPTNIATITGIANPTITASSGAASNRQTISGELYSLPNGTADEYDGQAAKLTRRIGKIVLDGTETWVTGDTGGDTPYLATFDFVFSPTGRTASICTHYVYNDAISGGNTAVGFRVTPGASQLIFRPGNVDTTVEAWTAYLAAQAEANTPVTIYYELANPEITEAAYDLTCYDGDTTFSAPGVPAENLSVTLLDGRTVGNAARLGGLPPWAYQQSNPNLLDNWDFRSGCIVNQKGLLEYGDFGAAFDRWRVNGLTVSIEDGGVSLSATAPSSTFFQKIPINLAGEIVTISAQTQDGTIITYSLRCPSESSSITAQLPLFIQTYQGVLLLGIILDKAGDTMKIRRMKLELGPVSTLHLDPPADYGTELAKCQRYLLVLDNTIPSLVGTIPIAVATNIVHVYIPLPVTMYRVPTSPENLISDFCIHQPNNTNIEITNIRGIYASANMVNISIDVPGVVAGVPCRLESKSGTSNPILLLSAEL